MGIHDSPCTDGNRYTGAKATTISTREEDNDAPDSEDDDNRRHPNNFTPHLLIPKCPVVRHLKRTC
jgi:hypothetical protein